MVRVDNDNDVLEVYYKNYITSYSIPIDRLTFFPPDNDLKLP